MPIIKVIGVVVLSVVLAGSVVESKADCIGGPSNSFVQIVSGGYHTCGLTAEGAAYCWGRDDNGQLGDGGTGTDSQSPVMVDTSPIAGEKSFTMLAAGNRHTCGITSEGAAYCWGDDFYGQLGDGGTGTDSQIPVAVEHCIQSCLLDTDCGLCEQCDLGSCAPQPAGSDVKDECPEGDCLTGACDGASACGVEAAGTVCGSLTDTDCDNPDTCDGAGTCLANYEVWGTACGSSLDTDCDNPDSCDGVGNCLPNYETSGASCADVFFCNGEETCDGLGICRAGSDPCAPLECNEAIDQCVGCVADADCTECRWCNVPNCQDQEAGSDLKDDCPAGECLTGSCDGNGACGYEMRLRWFISNRRIIGRRHTRRGMGAVSRTAVLRARLAAKRSVAVPAGMPSRFSARR